MAAFSVSHQEYYGDGKKLHRQCLPKVYLNESVVLLMTISRRPEKIALLELKTGHFPELKAGGCEFFRAALPNRNLPDLINPLVFNKFCTY